MSGKTVLLVDDDESIRESMVGAFEDLGIPFVVACSGKEAWEIYQANKDVIGLVLTDCRMPGDTAQVEGTAGIELAKKIRAIDNEIKIALHTNETSEITQAIAGLGITLIEKIDPKKFEMIDYLLGRNAPPAVAPPAAPPANPFDTKRNSWGTDLKDNSSSKDPLGFP